MTSSSSPLQVLFLASEADPFVKVGGLGDVAGSLPKAIRRLHSPPSHLTSDAGEEGNVDIRLVIPFHGAINRNAYDLIQIATINVPHADGPIRGEVFQTELNGLPVYLIGGQPISPGAPVYSDDLGFDAHKYVFFSLAALELTRTLDWQPHIIHANDWHTAAAVYALSLRRPTDPFFRHTASVLSVHNLPYLGVGADVPLSAFGLPPAVASGLPDWAVHILLPLGLLSADQIVAVSPTYAQEILTPEFGSGLHDFLRTRQAVVSGILNGIDTQYWDPATDRHLVSNYSQKNLGPRSKNKAALRREFELDPDHTWLDERTPLMAMITRMDYQKGVDLTVDALSKMTDQPWQIIILGTGQFELEAIVYALEQNRPDQVRAVMRFDPNLSHRLYAGADMLLMPSRYEPCGLTQMIALRYGCVPVARATGGLCDTIRDDYEKHEKGESTGFLFTDATPEALTSTLRRALVAYGDPAGWQEIQRRGMSQDFSWERSAREYVELYRELVAIH
jgi:starch synthase